MAGTEVLIQKRRHQWHISNLDYTRVRIIFLSLIWRMSVASQDPMWKNINLAPDEEPIRRMVHEGNPGEPWQDGFLCIVVLFDRKPIVDWLLDRDWVRSEWGRMYRLWVGGCIYLFRDFEPTYCDTNERSPHHEGWVIGHILQGLHWKFRLLDLKLFEFPSRFSLHQKTNPYA